MKMMGREYDGIRDLVAEQVERLEKLFPGKNHLWQKDIVQAYGVSSDFVRERFGVGRDGIDTLSFAWLLARKACKIEQRASFE
jgi:hypothetical protein